MPVCILSRSIVQRESEGMCVGSIKRDVIDDGTNVDSIVPEVRPASTLICVNDAAPRCVGVPCDCGGTVEDQLRDGWTRHSASRSDGIIGGEQRHSA